MIKFSFHPHLSFNFLSIFLNLKSFENKGKGPSMENREDLNSILPFLPLCLRSSSLFWPPPVVEAFKALSQGPHYSNVNSGQVLFLAIFDIRNSLSLPDSSISSAASDGFALFFDDVNLFYFSPTLFVYCVVFNTRNVGAVNY